MNIIADRRRTRRGARIVARTSLCAAAVLASYAAHAGSPDWSAEPFVYTTQGSSVADTLSVFATVEHVALQVTGPVDGRVTGRFSMPPQQFLDTLCATYGLVWDYDGKALEVSAASAQQRLTIRPNYMTPQALLTAVQDMGAADPHFALQVDAATGSLVAYGPSGYVARVSDAAQRVEAVERERTRTSVRLFRLHVATAADQTREVDGHSVVVPGIATLLNERVHHHAAGTAVEFDAALPIIEADAATNSILVRDRPERIDGDGVLVADADVKPDMVSLQTWVIDVATDALPGLQAALSQGLEPGRAVVLDDGGRALLAQLGELRQANRARVEMSRTAFTFDRSPAVLDRHEARMLAHATDTDEGADLWLSVVPTMEPDAGSQRISLHVDWARPGKAAVSADPDAQHDAANTQHDTANASGTAAATGATASVTAGQGLVVLGGGAGPAMRRVIVIVPVVLA